jgi:hypothetical protein
LLANAQSRAKGFPAFKALGFVYFFPGIKPGANDTPLRNPSAASRASCSTSMSARSVAGKVGGGNTRF